MGLDDQPVKGQSAVEQTAVPARCPLPKATRRVGAAAIGLVLFFLFKGLLWVAVPTLAVWWRSR